MTDVVAGVDLGGTNIKAALASENGELIAENVTPTCAYEGPPRVIERIANLLSAMATEHNARISAIGVGVPGLVNLDKGMTKFLPNLPTQWRDIPVAESLGSQLKCSVKLLNDVRTATLGELRFGHGSSQPDLTMAFISIGTGVGGGVVVEGNLRMGPLGAAGELGHQTIIADGPLCGCGNKGCLEAIASGSAIIGEGVRLMLTGLAPTLHQLVEGDASKVTPREMLTAAQEDEAVRVALKRTANYIGIAAANVTTILHPDLIVLGGGVAELGEILTSTVKSVITERVGMFPTDNVRVEQSLLGERAGVMGAIALAMPA